VALESAQQGIRFNPVAPGEIETMWSIASLARKIRNLDENSGSWNKKRSVSKILSAIAKNNKVTHRFLRSSISRTDSGVTRDHHGL
jgi:NAD(P)-dependent dehydrogenase (short-subunit alcohol dehydrogenase family)